MKRAQKRRSTSIYLILRRVLKWKSELLLPLKGGLEEEGVLKAVKPEVAGEQRRLLAQKPSKVRMSKEED